MIKSVVGQDIDTFLGQIQIRTSGLSEVHYSPRAKVLINKKVKPGEGLIALADVPTPLGVVRLASPLNTKEYARTLYSAFRLADNLGLKKIIVEIPSGHGITNAIRDRVYRAASD